MDQEKGKNMRCKMFKRGDGRNKRENYDYVSLQLAIAACFVAMGLNPSQPNSPTLVSLLLTEKSMKERKERMKSMD